MKKRQRACLHLMSVSVLMLCVPAGPGRADWPTHCADVERSGVTAEVVPAALELAWVRRSRHKPSPAWCRSHIAPERTRASTYDLAYQVVVAGGRLFYGSSSEDAVFCLDARTGDALWSFVTEGAVRLAPTVWEGRVYFGSDDGCAYCLEAETGELVWRYHAGPRHYRAVVNGRISSQWPVRTGVAVKDGIAYFAAGIFPPHGLPLCALDAETGREVWTGEAGSTPEGTIVVDDKRIYLPTGWTAPLEFMIAGGTPGRPVPDLPLDYRRTGGGAFAGMLGDVLVYGPNVNSRIGLRTSRREPPRKGEWKEATKPEGTVTGVMGQRMIRRGDVLYFLRTCRAGSAGTGAENALIALEARAFFEALDRAGQKGFKYGWLQDREDPEVARAVEAFTLWSHPTEPDGLCMILAGDTLFIGRTNGIAAHSTADGRRIWRTETTGSVWDLAVSDERLYASTDAGLIYCYGGEGQGIRHEPETAWPYPDDDLQRELRELAETAVEQSGRTKGFCVVLGSEDGRLAAEIARQSDYYVLALETDEENVAGSRRDLSRAGLYGTRVVVHRASPERLTYAGYFANLVVSQSAVKADRPFAWDCEEVCRLVRPHGGTLVLKVGERNRHWDRWMAAFASTGPALPGEERTYIVRRGRLPGAGEWTHIHAGPDSTASSGDLRVRGLAYDLQWMGPPGSRRTVDRHQTPMPPLYKDGRLFRLGREHLTVLDAYNGTYLWEMDITEANRRYMSHDSGLMCVDEESFYIARAGDCLVLDPETGRERRTLTVPEEGKHWGYVGVSDGVLLGSSQHAEASMRTHDNRRDHLGIMLYQFRPYAGDERVDRSEIPHDSNPTISDSLFATDTESWERTWTYRNGRILNTSYAVNGGRVFFAECRSEEVVNHPTGRVNLVDFFASAAFLVALDLQTGEKLWEVRLEGTRTNHCFYLAAWKDIVFYLNSHFLEDMTCVFSSRAYDVSDGSERWRSEVSTEKRFPYRWAGNDSGHNQTWQIPVVVGGKAYINFPMNRKTGVIDLQTGREESTDAVWSNRCTPFSASATNLYFRAGYTSTYDVTLGENAPVTRVTRPSCWISILPAGGLLQMPEGQSINCRCGYPIRTSVVMVPRTGPDEGS